MDRRPVRILKKKEFFEEDFPDLLPAAPQSAPAETPKVVKSKEVFLAPSDFKREDVKDAGGAGILSTKRTKKMGLFDIMNIQASKHSKKVVAEGNTNISSSSSAKGKSVPLEKNASKTKVAMSVGKFPAPRKGKNKKKRFSTLKRKLMMERLLAHLGDPQSMTNPDVVARHLKQKSDGSVSLKDNEMGDETCSESEQHTRVKIMGYLDREMIPFLYNNLLKNKREDSSIDEEEIDEILTNLNQLLGLFGKVVDITVVLLGEADVVVEAQYDRAASAAGAASSLGNVHISGGKLSVEILSSTTSSETAANEAVPYKGIYLVRRDAATKNGPDSTEGEGGAVLAWRSEQEKAADPSLCVLLGNLVTPNEVLEWLSECPALEPLPPSSSSSSGDSEGDGDGGVEEEVLPRGAEEACDVLEEIAGLVESYGRLLRVWIQASVKPEGEGEGPRACMVGVQFTSRGGALRALRGMQGQMVGGTAVEAILGDSRAASRIYEGAEGGQVALVAEMLCSGWAEGDGDEEEEDIEEEEEEEEEAGDGIAEAEGGEVKVKKKRRRRKKGGAAAPPSQDGPAAPSQPVSIFKTAAHAPKQVSHAQDGGARGSALLKALTAVSPTASPELCAEIKQMLTRLAEIQTAARLKDPLKAKSKQRFVTGLRQCLIGTRAGLAKLVLVAPDTETSEELDSRLAELMKAARDREVPLLYSLSRRQLGKACQTNTRQSCVAVYDAQGPGAMEVYKRCVQLAETHVAPAEHAEALLALLGGGGEDGQGKAA